MERAMNLVKDEFDFQVTWQPYLLRPEMPREGAPKAPATPGNPRVGGHLKDAGQKVGIDFTGAADRYPNTIQAHILLDLAKAAGADTQDRVAEQLFQAYFTDGSILDEASLLTIAQNSGLNPDTVRAALSSEESWDKIRGEARDWSLQVMSGVPTFFMNGQKTFSGAQDADNFVKVFRTVAERFPVQANV